MSSPPFDVDAFLARPLLARVAAAGPSVRPVWYLWEVGAFWWITGAYARLPAILARDPRVALVVDSCDLATGEVRQVTARGDAVLEPFDAARARSASSRGTSVPRRLPGSRASGATTWRSPLPRPSWSG